MRDQSGPCHHVWSPPHKVWLMPEGQISPTRDREGMVEDPTCTISFCLDCPASQLVERDATPDA